MLRLEDDLLLEHYKEIVENYYASAPIETNSN